MSKFKFITAMGMVALLSIVVSAIGVAAGDRTFTVTGQETGTTTSVPVDIFGTSCTQFNGATFCTGTSALGIFSGSSSGGPSSGPYTGQALTETVPVVGTGCATAPSTIQACTIGKNSEGCLFTYVNPSSPVGGALVDRHDFTGELSFYYVTGGSLCLDTNTGAYEGTRMTTCYGGTGKASSGCFGTTNLTTTFTGAILLSDQAGNGFNWFSDTYTGTGTK
jgi:hypothetical protein